MRFEITPDLDLSSVLANPFLQQKIFESILGISVVPGKAYKSPFRKDDSPNCSFRWYKGRLRFHDYNAAKSYDCVDTVCWKYGCSFLQALEHIQTLDENLVEAPQALSLVNTAPKKQTRIQYQTGNWKPEDQLYWQSYGISSTQLLKYNVKSCDIVWINLNINYIYNQKELCYVYLINNSNFKLYFPLRKKRDPKGPRFLTQGNELLQGYQQLPSEGEFLVITSSLKDVMVLDKLGIPAVAPGGETELIKPEKIAELEKRFTYLLCLPDYDATGIEMARRYRNAYGIPSRFIRDSCKDPSGYLKKYGLTQFTERMQTLFPYEILPR